TTCPTPSLTGLLVGPLVIETPPGAAPMIGVRLRPAGATALVDVPLHEFTGSAVSLQDLVGAEAERLSARLHEAETHLDRLHIMAGWLTDRLLARSSRIDPVVAYAVAAIEHAGGRMPVADITE